MKECKEEETETKCVVGGKAAEQNRQNERNERGSVSGLEVRDPSLWSDAALAPSNTKQEPTELTDRKHLIKKCIKMPFCLLFSEDATCQHMTDQTKMSGKD